MATWITHLRVAEKLLDHFDWNPRDFFVGNLAPDCGVPNEDWSSFEPPSHVSHWKKPGETKNRIDKDAFFAQHVLDHPHPFYIGYYCHLYCDILWSEYISRPTYFFYGKEFARDDQFIWEVKKDWYGLDALFLKEQAPYEPLELLKSLGNYPNRYLDYYPEDAFTRQISYIVKFYQDIEIPENRSFEFLNRDRYERYVQESARRIVDDLRRKL